MASTQIEQTAKCPHCHEEVTTLIWAGIDGNENPELRQALLDGSLFAWECPHCQKQENVLNDLFYFDTEKHFAILLQRETDKTFMPAERILPNCEQYDVLRLCPGFLSTCEKIICLEQGLHDRALEIYKMFLLTSVENAPDYFVCEGVGERGLLMSAWRNKKSEGVFIAATEPYHQIWTDLKEEYASKEKNTFWRVDQTWAMDYISETYRKAHQAQVEKTEPHPEV